MDVSFEYKFWKKSWYGWHPKVHNIMREASREAWRGVVKPGKSFWHLHLFFIQRKSPLWQFTPRPRRTSQQSCSTFGSKVFHVIVQLRKKTCWKINQQVALLALGGQKMNPSILSSLESRESCNSNIMGPLINWQIDTTISQHKKFGERKHRLDLSTNQTMKIKKAAWQKVCKKT